MIWAYREAVQRRLLAWGVVSVGVGLALGLWGSAFWRAFGVQCIAWGAIYGRIAWAGLRDGHRRGQPVDVEARNLRRRLWISAGVTVALLGLGLWLALRPGSHGTSSLEWQGHGWGLILQGTFLLLFSTLHVKGLPEARTLPEMEFFPGEAHRPFHLVGGRPAALVIHGFPGTPEEMRAIGEALHGQGWTVQGLLLPGFGAEIRTLIERRYAEWQAAVEGALAELKRDHHPVLLVGYSFGAALSIHTATRLAPDGLVLLAPFWWAEPRWLAPASLFLSPFLPHAVRPYARSNFGDPHFRAGLAKLLPEADWDDPATQHAIRRLAVPTTLFQEVRETRQVITLVRQLNLPTLIVQGRQDAMVRAANTQRLVAEWGKQAQPRRAPRYVEVDAGHDLTERRSMGWAHVERAVLEFSAQYLQ